MSGRRALAVVVVLLAVAPAALTAARQAEFTSSVEMRPVPPATAPVLAAALPLRDTIGSYLRRELSTEATRIGIAAELDSLIGTDQLPDALSLARRPAPEPNAVVATAPSPSRARELARVAGLQLVAASSREVDATARAALDELLRELDAAPSAATRAVLARRRALLERALDNPPSRVYPATEPTVPALSGVDRALDALPGDLPPRPSPLLAGACGALAGLGLGLGLRARRRMSDGA